MNLKIASGTVGKRIDSLLYDHLHERGNVDFSNLSRSFIADHIEGFVLINGKKVKKSHKVDDGDVVEIDEGKLHTLIKAENERKDAPIIAQKGNLDVVEEDSDWMVVNKPSGVVMHPGDGNREGTLANWIKYYLESKKQYDSSVRRAGIVHRLDKGVSGLVLVAKNRKTQLLFKDQFENREVDKVYSARIEGEYEGEVSKETLNEALEALEKSNFRVIEDEWVKIEGWIGRDVVNRKRMKLYPVERVGAKYALTYIKAISKKDLVVVIKTGRMHQIRSSLKKIGYIIVGDTLYKSKNGQNPNEISLKSVLLSFATPRGERKTLKLI